MSHFARAPRGRRSAVALAVAVALSVALTQPATALALARPALAARIRAAVRASAVSGSHLGVFVSVATETVPVTYVNRTKLFLPASTMKLVTSSAAFDRLGPYFRWSTRVSLESTPTTAGVVTGNLYLVGGGDPTLATRVRKKKLGISGSSYIDDLADALKAKGVKRITGALVADESFFDSRRIGNGWKTSYTDECPPLSALTLDRNIATWGGWVESPPLSAGRTFKAMLASRGIKVVGGVRTGRTPARRYLAATEWSSPLFRVVAPMNRNSDNFIGEMLAKTNGRMKGGAGSTTAGARVSASELTSAGVPAAQYRVVDGSGLSRYNRLAPAAVVSLLRYAARRPWGRYLDMSLPVAGVNGTLADRMRGTAAQRVVHAKTGTLRDVSALSGYATARSGTRFAFSVITNGEATADSRALQDRIAIILAAYTGR